MRRLGEQLVVLWERWGRYINLSALASGFAFDLFLAKRPDSIADNILLVFYLLLCGAIIILLNMRSARRRMEAENPAEPLLLLLVLQFCFGGLANNLLILYGKSGTVGGSLLFVLLLAAFALSNEFLKSRYAQLRLNVGIYYFLLLTYLVIATPTFLLHSIGVWVFLASGALSLVIIAGFLAILYTVVFRKKRAAVTGVPTGTSGLLEVSIIVVGIFLVFNALYFLNIIPPVPLSLKSIGVYHSLATLPVPDTNGAIYSATYEPPAWWVFWRDTASTYTIDPPLLGVNDNAYCFSAVFAPGDLSTPIEHRWEKYDATAKKWETVSLVAFPINGGRAEGYRGYSIESALTSGKWRCDVETARGQLVGRISFTVVENSTAPALSTTAL